MRAARWILTCIIAGLGWGWGVPFTGAESPMKLLDATFTDEIVNREPRTRLTSFTLGEQPDRARLWFWFQVHCGELCLDGQNSGLKIPIMVKWAYEQDKMFVVKRTVPLTVESMTWRTWAYKENLKPGTWQVVIFSQEGPVCLEEQCEFMVQVTP